MKKKILISICIISLFINCLHKLNATIEYEIVCRLYSEEAMDFQDRAFILDTKNFVMTMSVLYWYREQISFQKIAQIADSGLLDIRFETVLSKIENSLNYFWRLHTLAIKIHEPHHAWRTFCRAQSEKPNANEQFADLLLTHSISLCEPRYYSNGLKVCGDEILPLEWNWGKDTTFDQIIQYRIDTQLNAIDSYKEKYKDKINQLEVIY